MDGETIFAILVGAALGVFSLVMVAYSFFRGPSTSSGQAQSSPAFVSAGDDGVGLDSIYDSIDTLELEYQLGNLTEGQYRDQLQAYRLEAAAVIKSQLEQGAAPPELLLEQEVIAARAELRSAEPAEGTRPEPVEGWQACFQCDAPIPAALGQSGGVCPHCGAYLSELGLPGFEDSRDEESC
jgi:hypothetical protein